ncbi:MAG: SAM-dependent chlorinase/fluorinase, partial [Ignavibacteria bacterium]
MRSRPTIALLTDFGLSDPYVGSMKGVISAIAPGTPILDLSHEVLPQNITQAGYLLWSCYKYFPAGTIFVCVVDPGVGSGRRVLCVDGAGYRFLGPDNGLLQLVLDSLDGYSIVIVENRRYFRNEISPTFHGRDIFAPVAAHLSRGVRSASLGRRTTS